MNIPIQIADFSLVRIGRDCGKTCETSGRNALKGKPAEARGLTIYYHTRGEQMPLEKPGHGFLKQGQKVATRHNEGPTKCLDESTFCGWKMEWQPTSSDKEYLFGQEHLISRKTETLLVPCPISPSEMGVLKAMDRPPCQGLASTLWYQGKILELVAFALQEEDSSSSRQDQLARERTAKVCAILKEEFVEPPSLKKLARLLGCSACHLSRTFSATMGQSIPQFIREQRILRAAELLRSGKYNVTEAAFAVGYSSLGHFSQAFREITGCCPGLYPMRI